MLGGYHDRVAWVDLTKGKIEVRPIGEADAVDFIGGSCLGAAILARLTDGETDPLGPDNPLIMMTGPFTGTNIPAGGRYEVVTLSPVTGGYGEANSGGAFGRQLKGCGLDGIVFTGASEKPVILVIEEDGIRLEDGEPYWGQEIYEGDEALKTVYGKDVVNAMIGPGGERMVAFAAIGHDGKHTRFAGRCGVGAVMGSKLLKAVVVSGKGKAVAPVAKPDELAASVKGFTPEIQETLENFRTYGTGGGLIICDEIGDLPIDNWRTGKNTPLSKKITGTTMIRDYQLKRSGCKRCTILCARTMEVKDGPFATVGEISGPEYETMASFGSLLNIEDPEAIIKLNERCNNLGLDTISAGMVIAFAFECFEKGIVTLEDTDGLELTFGDGASALALLERLGRPESVFDCALAGGSRRAAEIFGGMAPEYALEVKGVELPMHDPRYSWGQALSYATSNRGACHLAGFMNVYEDGGTIPELGLTESHPNFQREGKGEITAMAQNLMNVMDSLVLCKFAAIADAASYSRMAEWYTMITGRAITVQDFNTIGERGFNLKRMINNRFGIGRKDDTLPPRMRTLRKVSDDFDLDVPPLAPMLSDYYTVRGWTEEGRPDSETLSRLGLSAFAD